MKTISLEDFGSNLNEFEKRHAPKEIHYRGDLSLLTTNRRISVVGSRQVTSEGSIRAKAVTSKLVQHGITVVSGMASGVDTIAHKTAIECHGRTIAVLGSSVYDAYPKENKNLLEEIAQSQLVISQFSNDHPITPKNFPIRNRTMALISDGTIIIEASESSGTRHQGWEALRLGRRLFILESIIKKDEVSWAIEMLNYGAEILTRENIDEILVDIPELTSLEDVEFC